MSDVYFSVIVYVDDDTKLKRSIQSVMDVTNYLVNRIKVIVVDPICSEASVSLCNAFRQKFGEEYFVYLKVLGASIAEAYNIAIPEIAGRYVNFSLASTYFQENTLAFIADIAEDLGRPKLISAVPWTVNEKDEQVQYTMSPNIDCNTSQGVEIDLYDNPDKLQLMFHAYFIRCYLIHSRERNMWFNTELHDDAIPEMLLNLLAEIHKYVYISYKLHYSVQMEDNTSAFINQHYEWWYNDSFKNWILPFAKHWSEQDWPLRMPMRRALLYYVYVRYACNYNDKNKGVLHGDKLSEFAALTGQILQYIDNSVIWKNAENQKYIIPRTLKVLFFKLKAYAANSECEPVVYGKDLYLWTHRVDITPTERAINVLDSEFAPSKEALENVNKELSQYINMFVVKREDRVIPEVKMAYENNSLNRVASLEKEHVLLKAVNYQKRTIVIDGTFSLGDFVDVDKIKLFVIKDKIRIPVAYSEIYGLNKIFGVTYNHKFNFKVSIPVYSRTNKAEIRFVLEMNGVDTVVDIRTPAAYTHIKMGIKGQYWKFCDDWYMSAEGSNKLVLNHTNAAGMKKKEADFQKELKALADKKNAAAKTALELRKQYFELEEQEEKERIWITFDKLYKAGDNGEYIYNYISKQNGPISIYYIIKEDSVDFERMNTEGNHLLIWGQKETLIKVLRAEAILGTHSDVFSYAGFDKAVIPYVCDLFNPLNVCIQHGLTVQNIAQYQNRVFDNLHLYTCASPNEIANLSRDIYGFEDKSVLKLTGLARYDGLVNNDQKQILITPTWRRSIANANIAHMKKGHNDYFKSSDYFTIYNTLINDPKLIACAKKMGYRLIYLLHPAASAQEADFDRNDYVEIIPAASDMNYEKILTESSLMVTDYSGVQFDFAYMRKPILYYHPKALPPHYDESAAYVYKTMAFGPIIDNHEELVDALCDYMSRKCVTEQQYVERADRFFAYSDFNNCKRIYHTVLEFLEEEAK